jgi:hypothetical protein
MSDLPPRPYGGDWLKWANRLVPYLSQVRDRLRYKRGDETASDNGILLWDNDSEKAVISNGGKYKALRYGHGDHLLVYTTATHSAASTNTAYAITWENSAYGDHIAVDDTVTSRIVFEHAGTYNIEFSCELQSGNNSSKTVYIWPRKNGTDLPYSTMVYSLKDSGESVTVTRSGIFSVEADDYIEAMFAVTDTNLAIQGSSATAFSPAAPSATMNIVEVDI